MQTVHRERAHSGKRVRVTATPYSVILSIEHCGYKNRARLREAFLSQTPEQSIVSGDYVLLSPIDCCDITIYVRTLPDTYPCACASLDWNCMPLAGPYVFELKHQTMFIFTM